MIPTIQYLSERAFTKGIDNFVTVCEMIVIDNEIISALVIIAVIVRRVIKNGRLLFASCPDAIYRGVIEDLFAFIIGEVLDLTALQHGYRELSVKVILQMRLPLPEGEAGVLGGIGSGNRKSSSSSSWVAPAASFFVCCLLM